METDGAVPALIDRKRLRNLLGANGGPAPEIVVLLGSWARGTPVPLSDVDLLLLYDSGRSPARSSGDLQLLSMSTVDLRRRLMDKDDFVQWALRFGLPMRGRNAWEELRQTLLPTAPWPDPDRKRRMAAERLRSATDMMALGDMEAAQEEARFAASHAARAELLARGVFPLSRPELPGQLREIGDQRLAYALDTLSSVDELTEGDVASALAVIRSRLGVATGPDLSTC